MKDARGRVIYVGKAASLRSRVRSYFQSGRGFDAKTCALVGEVADVETIVTADEREALILEDTLIKRHQPRYNVRLRDDKRYPYLKLTAERFPRLVLTRRIESDIKRGARYFGPYTNSGAMREARRVIQKIFRIRTCALDIPVHADEKPVRKRPCLDHFIGLCDAPCVGAIGESSYQRLVDEAALFLQGRHRELLPHLKREMAEASQNLEFERAARLRDRVRALERLLNTCKTLDPKRGDQDAIGLALAETTCAVQVFQVRDGVLIGRERFSLTIPEASEPTEALIAFLKQRYAQSTQIPREILLPIEIDESEGRLLERWLSDRRGTRVYLKTPKRGPKARLVQTAERNARLALDELALRALQGPKTEAVIELQRALRLAEPPRRIEGFDVSNFQGREPVASMVVFTDGAPDRTSYRRFQIREVEAPDDVAMLAEAVRRRFERALEGDEKFLPLPDLLLIDGGKGQLGAVRSLLRELGLSEVFTIALAKEHEEVFLEGRRRPLVLPRRSPALQLLQRVRDEAHRFALEHHRQQRKRRTLRSALDEIPGIGPKRKRALLKHFGSMKALREATAEELQQAGLPRNVAERLVRALHSNR
jgi:excinuclease ABC subunit C